nr:MAG TPA: hypothetical protein [Caudoviricetes sp.]
MNGRCGDDWQRLFLHCMLDEPFSLPIQGCRA